MSKRCRYCGKPFDVGPACRCASYAAEMIVRYGAAPQTLGEVYCVVKLRHWKSRKDSGISGALIAWQIWAARSLPTINC